MNKLIVLSLLAVVLVSCETTHKDIPSSKSFVQHSGRDTIAGIRGSDFAKVEDIKKGKIYTYPQAKISVTLSEDGVGEEIAVVLAGETAVFNIENIEAHHFFGVKDDCLFIDNGTSPNGRTIVVLDIKTHQHIHDARYEKDIVLKDNKMVYLTPIDTRRIRLRDTVCPDKDKWEKLGMSAGYAQYVSFDLGTKTVTETGNYSCYPIQ